jgi:hypothetical protein
VNNIKMDLREIGSDGMVWIGLDWFGSEYGPVEGSCEHGNEPSASIKFLSSCTIDSFSRRAQLHESWWIYTQSVGLIRGGISPSQDRYLHTEQHEHRINAHNTDIHALSGIRTHDPSVRAGEDSSCLRQRGHSDDRLFRLYSHNIYHIS